MYQAVIFSFKVSQIFIVHASAIPILGGFSRALVILQCICRSQSFGSRGFRVHYFIHVVVFAPNPPSTPVPVLVSVCASFH